MLHTLHIKNFTIFSDVQFEFSPGLNVIIGGNGTGKSHLLYLAYTILSVWHQALQNCLHSNKDKEPWQRDLTQKLTSVFRPEKLGHLCRHQQRCAEIQMIPTIFGQAMPQLTSAFSFLVTALDTIKLEQSPVLEALKSPKTRLEAFQQIPIPLFFPIKEILSFYPDFTNNNEKQKLSYAIYDDLCKALTNMPLTGKRAKEVTNLVMPLENIMQSSVMLELNRFYLQHIKNGKMEISLAPEGLRKIAMLTYLLKNGSLAKGSTLFWDEPEVSLNAKLQVKLVDTLVAMVNAGIQIVLATHDLFLMKELSLATISTKIPIHFFSLHQSEQGIEIEQGEQLDDLSNIVAIDAELDQTDRGQAIFYQEIFEKEAA